MDKRYICLVRGMMKPPSATCKAYLLKDAKAARVTILDDAVRGAKPIITEYETLESGPISRLLVHLVTGRTHQLRLHCFHIGHPILGDPQYGNSQSQALSHQWGLTHQLLCARSLEFDHPVTGEHLLLRSQIPIRNEETT